MATYRATRINTRHATLVYNQGGGGAGHLCAQRATVEAVRVGRVGRGAGVFEPQGGDGGGAAVAAEEPSHGYGQARAAGPVPHPPGRSRRILGNATQPLRKYDMNCTAYELQSI